MSASRRERKKQLQRERIMAAAAELIRSQGLAPTTVAQIADRADISQTTFFNYFRSKTHLLDELLGRFSDRFDAVMRESDLLEDGSPAERIRALFEVSAALTAAQQLLLRDLIGAVIRAPSARTDSRVETLRISLVTDLAMGQNRGEVRGDCSPEELADVVLGLYISVFLFWTATPDTDYPVAARLRTAARLALELIHDSKAEG
jgi:AcrR family transcriptional regulator